MKKYCSDAMILDAIPWYFDIDTVHTYFKCIFGLYITHTVSTHLLILYYYCFVPFYKDSKVIKSLKEHKWKYNLMKSNFYIKY